nr:MAG TPA: hypothetical protein [Caudoviricetes sp.]
MASRVAAVPLAERRRRHYQPEVSKWGIDSAGTQPESRASYKAVPSRPAYTRKPSSSGPLPPQPPREASPTASLTHTRPKRLKRRSGREVRFETWVASTTTHRTRWQSSSVIAREQGSRSLERTLSERSSEPDLNGGGSSDLHRRGPGYPRCNHRGDRHPDCTSPAARLHRRAASARTRLARKRRPWRIRPSRHDLNLHLRKDPGLIRRSRSRRARGPDRGGARRPSGRRRVRLGR